jgi:hypothetical protein
MKEINKCIHKWKFHGFYSGGYFNTKSCIKCNAVTIELNKKKKQKKYEELR